MTASIKIMVTSYPALIRILVTDWTPNYTVCRLESYLRRVISRVIIENIFSRMAQLRVKILFFYDHEWNNNRSYTDMNTFSVSLMPFLSNKESVCCACEWMECIGTAEHLINLIRVQVKFPFKSDQDKVFFEYHNIHFNGKKSTFFMERKTPHTCGTCVKGPFDSFWHVLQFAIICKNW